MGLQGFRGRRGVRVEQQLQDVVETAWLPLPCLVTVEQDIYTPRLPSLLKRRAVKDKPVDMRGLDAFLDTDPSYYGLTGSPTQVERIFPPQSDVEHETWEGDGSAGRLHELLKKWKFV